jgi:hypothetical protein
MKNLFKSLAAFQQECPTIHKGTQGYGYSYADLASINNVINPLLAKHGMGYTQELDGEALVTTIFHSESGEFRSSRANLIQGVQLKGMNEFQVFGSNLTYMRRYCISAALGIVTDKDVDAAGEQVKTSAPAKKPRLEIGSDNFKKAKEYVMKGGALEDVWNKYDMDKKTSFALTSTDPIHY